MTIIATFRDYSSKFTEKIELNGEMFYLSFNWNTRAQQWYMTIADADENILLASVKLIIEYPLNNIYKDLNGFPKGIFYIWDLEENESTAEMTYDEFGSRYQLVFFTDEEIAG